MPRPRKPRFRSELLDDLTRQLLFAPPSKRAEQVIRAERLHDEIDREAAYPFEYISYRVTGHRAPTSGQDPTLLVGQAVEWDLRELIDVLSRSVDLPDDGQSPGVEALARQMNVSAKTIHRWREAGLRWRWVKAEAGQPRRLVFPAEAIEHYLARNGKRVARAAEFSQIPPHQRERIIERARFIAQGADVSLHRVATHLARKHQRGVETIRQILEQHDRQHPEQAIFADRTGPLSASDRRLIARAHRMGVPMGTLCRRFKRTRATIYRVVHCRRAAALRRLRIACTTLPTFEREDADAVLLSMREPQPAQQPPRRRVQVSDLPEALRPYYRQPPLDPAVERWLLIRLNYLKFKAATLRGQLDRYTPRVGQMREIESLLAQAQQLTRRLVAAYLPVVLSVARRQLINEPNPSPDRLLSLLELGNRLLLDAVETFDIARNQGFEPYLTYRLMREYCSQQPTVGSDGQPRARKREPVEAVTGRILEQARRLAIEPEGDQA